MIEQPTDAEQPAEQPAQKAAMMIFYDPGTQTVRIVGDPEQVKNWDFSLALLRMSQDCVETQRRMQSIAQMQQMAAAQQQSKAIRRQLQLH